MVNLTNQNNELIQANALLAEQRANDFHERVDELIKVEGSTYQILHESLKQAHFKVVEADTKMREEYIKKTRSI